MTRAERMFYTLVALCVFAASAAWGALVVFVTLVIMGSPK